MELWIRSQDKEKLLKANDIAIEKNMIYGYFDKSTEYEHLGTYKSKERALEVLDDIVELIKHIKCQRISPEAWQQALLNYSDEEREHLLSQMCVYQMPEN